MSERTSKRAPAIGSGQLKHNRKQPSYSQPSPQSAISTGSHQHGHPSTQTPSARSANNSCSRCTVSLPHGRSSTRIAINMVSLQYGAIYTAINPHGQHQRGQSPTRTSTAQTAFNTGSRQYRRSSTQTPVIANSHPYGQTSAQPMGVKQGTEKRSEHPGASTAPRAWLLLPPRHSLWMPRYPPLQPNHCRGMYSVRCVTCGVRYAMCDVRSAVAVSGVLCAVCSVQRSVCDVRSAMCDACL